MLKTTQAYSERSSIHRAMLAHYSEFRRIEAGLSKRAMAARKSALQCAREAKAMALAGHDLRTYHSMFSHIRNATHISQPRRDNPRGTVFFDRLDDIAGRASEQWTDKHGYYADEDCDTTFKPVVVLLQTGKRAYLIPGYIESNNDGYLLDMSNAYRVAREDTKDHERKGVVNGLEAIDDALDDMKHDARSMAERNAENAREYDEAWNNGQSCGYEMARINMDGALAKDALRALYDDYKAMAHGLARSRMVIGMRRALLREADMLACKHADRLKKIADARPSNRNQSDIADAWRGGYESGLDHGA